MDVIVVSIGALSKNLLWGEKTAVRASHGTTTLIREGKNLILVDPALPLQILEARLFERTGLKPGAITHVFLTNWRPAHRRALPLFGHAKWLMFEIEIQAAQRALDEIVARAERELHTGSGSRPTAAERAEDAGQTTADVEALLASEAALLRRVDPAPDEIIENVDLFPLPGYTEGQAGLLVTTPMNSLMIAGDAVPTAEHFGVGQVFADCWDLDLAKQSLAEMYEIADMIVPGHDNLFQVPRAAGL